MTSPFALLRSLQLHIPAPATVAINQFVRLRTTWTARKKHAEIEALLTAPDFVLRDIGVSHGDVVEALSKPVADSGLHLKVLAARRRFTTSTRDPL
ncbi:hypothetical protein [Ahrensia sp. R2A130]|uniref:hypothetical protein n=1 Tax=Ahrensia sp. R2A130 TaxID=744979 RepID=UPI0001E08C64|nr:hypothetical protein [Ahrensia sp. R2A130]EFL88526.1 hypothetical protein R2A130_1008 [Ahrensia sp. R2A130]